MLYVYLSLHRFAASTNVIAERAVGVGSGNDGAITTAANSCRNPLRSISLQVLFLNMWEEPEPISTLEQPANYGHPAGIVIVPAVAHVLHCIPHLSQWCP